jgi:hypothetical protein
MKKPGLVPGFFSPDRLPGLCAAAKVGAGLPAIEGAALAAFSCLARIFCMPTMHRTYPGKPQAAQFVGFTLPLKNNIQSSSNHNFKHYFKR